MYHGLYLLILSVVVLVAVAIWINVKPQPEIKILEKQNDEWWEIDDEMEP